jgi:Tol biopolymer transport system component
MDYLDFDLEIGPGSGRSYPIAVIRSPAGEAHNTMTFPFDDQELQEHLERVQHALVGSGQVRRQAAHAVEEFGTKLFEALFIADLRSCYDVSLREASRQEKGLRVKLRIQAPNLAALPWEFLYDPRQGEYVCLSMYTPLVRYLELPQSVQPLQVKPPLRVLCMIASPSDQDPLDITREQGRLQESLKELVDKGLVELTWLPGQTSHDLQRAMQGGPWHIFHFIGHGGFDPTSDEGLLALANEQGKTALLTANQLGRLLADHRSLRLALLNACEGAQGSERDLFSSTAATLARRGIPAVLAMQYEISDKAAIECTRTFYESIASGMPVDAAVAEARKAISLGISNTLEWGTPVLYMRSSDGALFDLAPPAAQPAKSAPAKSTAHTAPTVKRGTLICTYRGHDNWVMHLAWSPDGSKIASVQKFDHLVHIWDTEVGGHLFTYTGHPANKAVWGLAWSPDSTRVASASEDGTVQVWEAEDGKLIRTYSKHQGTVYAVAWSPDGSKIASGGEDETLQIWGVKTGAQIFTGTHPAHVSTLAWSPDSQQIVVGCNDSTIRVWDASSGDITYEYDGHEDAVYDIAWSPDGKHIASGSEDGLIHVWSPTPGQPVIVYREHQTMFLHLAWSADSKHIASVGDEVVYIWDAKTGKTVYTYRGHQDTVRAVGWSADGTRIASGSHDTTIHVWRIN